MPQVYEGRSEDDANPIMTDDFPQEEDGGKESLVERMKEKAKLPTLKDKVKKLKSKVPLRKNKNNSSEDGTDDDALLSQVDGHEKEDDSCSGEEYDFQKETLHEDASKQQQKALTPVVLPNIPENRMFTMATTPRSSSSSSHTRYMSYTYLCKSVYNSEGSILLKPGGESCYNVQEVEPESGGATNNNSAGGFTGLKNTVIGSPTAAAGTMRSTFGYYSGGDHAHEKPSSRGGDQGGNTYNNQQTTDHPATGLQDDAAGTKSGETNNATTGEDDETYIQKAHAVVLSHGLDKPFDLNASLFLDKTKEYVTSTTDVAESYTSAATEMNYNTIDKVGSATAPRHEEKGLAQRLTETLSNLPTTSKESIFDPSSPTLNLATSAISSPRDGAPGLLSHVTGAVSSLFSSNKPAESITVDDAFPEPHDNPRIPQEATGQGLNDEEENNSPAFHHSVNT